jgi:hypothetical protein
MSQNFTFFTAIWRGGATCYPPLPYARALCPTDSYSFSPERIFLLEREYFLFRPECFLL